MSDTSGYGADSGGREDTPVQSDYSAGATVLGGGSANTGQPAGYSGGVGNQNSSGGGGSSGSDSSGSSSGGHQSDQGSSGSSDTSGKPGSGLSQSMTDAISASSSGDSSRLSNSPIASIAPVSINDPGYVHREGAAPVYQVDPSSFSSKAIATAFRPDEVAHYQRVMSVVLNTETGKPLYPGKIDGNPSSGEFIASVLNAQKQNGWQTDGLIGLRAPTPSYADGETGPGLDALYASAMANRYGEMQPGATRPATADASAASAAASDTGGGPPFSLSKQGQQSTDATTDAIARRAFDAAGAEIAAGKANAVSAADDVSIAGGRPLSRQAAAPPAQGASAYGSGNQGPELATPAAGALRQASAAPPPSGAVMTPHVATSADNVEVGKSGAGPGRPPTGAAQMGQAPGLNTPGSADAFAAAVAAAQARDAPPAAPPAPAPTPAATPAAPAATRGPAPDFNEASGSGTPGAPYRLQGAMGGAAAPPDGPLPPAAVPGPGASAGAPGPVAATANDSKPARSAPAALALAAAAATPTPAAGAAAAQGAGTAIPAAPALPPANAGPELGPAIAGPAPQPPAPSPAANAVPGLDVQSARDAIASIETPGLANPYGAVGPKVTYPDGTTDHAYGKYQMMGNNIPSWTQQALGTPMTPQEFVKDHAAQDRTFDYQFGKLAQQYGNPYDAASAWFTGQPRGSYASQARDVNKTSGADYVSKFAANYDKGTGTGQSGTQTAGASQEAPTSPTADALSPPMQEAIAASSGSTGGMPQRMQGPGFDQLASLIQPGQMAGPTPAPPPAQKTPPGNAMAAAGRLTDEFAASPSFLDSGVPPGVIQSKGNQALFQQWQQQNPSRTQADFQRYMNAQKAFAAAGGAPTPPPGQHDRASRADLMSAAALPAPGAAIASPANAYAAASGKDQSRVPGGELSSHGADQPYTFVPEQMPATRPARTSDAGGAPMQVASASDIPSMLNDNPDLTPLTPAGVGQELQAPQTPVEQQAPPGLAPAAPEPTPATPIEHRVRGLIADDAPPTPAAQAMQIATNFPANDDLGNPMPGNQPTPFTGSGLRVLNPGVLRSNDNFPPSYDHPGGRPKVITFPGKTSDEAAPLAPHDAALAMAGLPPMTPAAGQDQGAAPTDLSAVLGGAAQDMTAPIPQTITPEVAQATEQAMPEAFTSLQTALTGAPPDMQRTVMDHVTALTNNAQRVLTAPTQQDKIAAWNMGLNDLVARGILTADQQKELRDNPDDAMIGQALAMGQALKAMRLSV